MNRQDFLNRLRAGLRGLAPQVAADIVADYEAHFAEGLAAGRSEAEVALALGDPARLARELRAEATLNRWETNRNPSAAAGAVWAVLGLGAIDLLILLPILTSVGGTLFSFLITALFGFIAGAFLFALGPFLLQGAPTSVILLTGLGVMSGAICIGALASMATIGCINALVWYGRLHIRVMRPVLEPEGSAA